MKQIEFQDKQPSRNIVMSVEKYTDGVVFDIDQEYKNGVIEHNIILSLTLDEARKLADTLALWLSA